VILSDGARVAPWEMKEDERKKTERERERERERKSDKSAERESGKWLPLHVAMTARRWRRGSMARAGAVRRAALKPQECENVLQFRNQACLLVCAKARYRKPPTGGLRTAPASAAKADCGSAG